VSNRLPASSNKNFNRKRLALAGKYAVCIWTHMLTKILPKKAGELDQQSLVEIVNDYMMDDELQTIKTLLAKKQTIKLSSGGESVSVPMEAFYDLSCMIRDCNNLDKIEKPNPIILPSYKRKGFGRLTFNSNEKLQYALDAIQRFAEKRQPRKRELIKNIPDGDVGLMKQNEKKQCVDNEMSQGLKVQDIPSSNTSALTKQPDIVPHGFVSPVDPSTEPRVTSTLSESDAPLPFFDEGNHYESDDFVSKSPHESLLLPDNMKEEIVPTFVKQGRVFNIIKTLLSTGLVGTAENKEGGATRVRIKFDIHGVINILSKIFDGLQPTNNHDDIRKYVEELLRKGENAQVFWEKPLPSEELDRCNKLFGKKKKLQYIAVVAAATLNKDISQVYVTNNKSTMSAHSRQTLIRHYDAWYQNLTTFSNSNAIAMFSEDAKLMLEPTYEMLTKLDPVKYPKISFPKNVKRVQPDSFLNFLYFKGTKKQTPLIWFNLAEPLQDDEEENVTKFMTFLEKSDKSEDEITAANRTYSYIEEIFDNTNCDHAFFGNADVGSCTVTLGTSEEEKE
jgi:hypothetical protein